MNKIRFYQFLVMGLLICNLVLLIFFLKEKKNVPPQDTRPRSVIIERLQFNPEQVQRYDVLIEKHQADTKQNAQQIKGTLEALYAQLAEAEQDSARIDSLQSALAFSKSAIDDLHYKHFLDIKELCTEEQLPQFSKLSKDLARLFAPEQRPNRRR